MSSFFPTCCDDEEQTLLGQEEEKEELVDIGEVLYASNAFFATLKPVSVTLIMSSLAVVYVTNEITENSDSGLEFIRLILVIFV